MTSPTRSGKTRRPLVLTAIVMAMFMAAIEATIVATAMPSIAAKLGGLSLYSWVFSSFLLMQAVTIPIYGKLADVFGRKLLFNTGIVIFLIASTLCGFAGSMMVLVVCRLGQGLGAGAIQPLAVTLIGDMYTLEERARVQGYVASVWGISAVLGPLAGALIVQYLPWAWVFWINVPFGLASIFLVSRYLHEHIEHRERSIDYAGAVLLLLALSSLMLALTQGSHWGVPAIALLVALAAGAFWMLLRQERWAADPVLHVELWRVRLIRLANLATLNAGVAMMGLIGFLPMFIQGVLHRSPVVAGLTLSMMSLGWPIASVIAGRALPRAGVPRLARSGGIALFAGSLIVALLGGYGPVAAASGSLLVGAGLGILNTTFIVTIQESVGWNQRGTATAMNILMRILGNALGAAVLGGVLNMALRRSIEAAGDSAGTSFATLQSLLEGTALPGAGTGALYEGFAAGLHGVFWTGVVFAGVVLVASWRIPHAQPAEPAPVQRPQTKAVTPGRKRDRGSHSVMGRSD
ncbi:MAG: MFS transporter [Burkholderiales bacterium]|nr:MFS transporter [Burkholderiales bacterium]